MKLPKVYARAALMAMLVIAMPLLIGVNSIVMSASMVSVVVVACTWSITGRLDTLITGRGADPESRMKTGPR